MTRMPINSDLGQPYRREAAEPLGNASTLPEVLASVHEHAALPSNDLSLTTPLDRLGMRGTPSRRVATLLASRYTITLVPR
jgi:hypothetical protein